jgi:protein-histidine pros-kinase
MKPWQFGLLFLGVLGFVTTLTALFSYGYFQQGARKQVLAQANLMMETALAMRTYTSEQIKPLTLLRRQSEFHQQWIPAYAATEIFNYLRAKYPEYTYREPTLNPTNLRDTAVGWEADVINVFRNDSKVKELTGERATPTGTALYLARPIVATKACLECHSVPAAAPKAMLQEYGDRNGFGWHLNEIIGAQVVSVPFSVSYDLAKSSFRILIASLLLVGIGALIAFYFALTFVVIRPLRRKIASSQRLSTHPD